MVRVPSEILRLPVAGPNLRPGTLGGQLDAGRTLLVFLRHLGCIFGREMVADLRNAADAGGLPPVLLVSQGPADATAAFFAGHWPGVPVVADPDRVLYAAFTVGRIGVPGLLGPAVWSCGIHAFAKGHRQQPGQTFRPTRADPWLLASLFLVGPDGTIAWSQRPKHAGERADVAGLRAFLQSDGAASGPLSRVRTGEG